MTDLSLYLRKVNQLQADQRQATTAVCNEEKELTRVKDNRESIVEAQKIVQQIAQTLQQQAHSKIARIVSQCLNVVFEDPYEFAIRFEQKRGKTEAKMVFKRDGMEFDDPLNSVGGGVIDIAALALRLACITLSRPVRRKLLVLDEPFKNVRGAENKRRTRSMLLRLSEDFGCQFIINTDIESYRVGTVVELS